MPFVDVQTLGIVESDPLVLEMQKHPIYAGCGSGSGYEWQSCRAARQHDAGQQAQERETAVVHGTQPSSTFSARDIRTEIAASPEEHRDFAGSALLALENAVSTKMTVGSGHGGPVRVEAAGVQDGVGMSQLGLARAVHVDQKDVLVFGVLGIAAV